MSMAVDSVTFHRADIADLIFPTSCNIHTPYQVKQRSSAGPAWMTATLSTYVITSCQRKKVRRLERLSTKFQKLSAEFRRQCQGERSGFNASATTRLG